MMKRFLLNLMLMMAAFALTSCKKDEVEVIPRSKLAQIYAEMLVTDQWITNTQGVRLIADTSMVYEPILEKYGYDIEDYLHSVDAYMDDPERFARIFRTSGEIIEKRLKELRRQQFILDQIASLPNIRVDFRPEEFAPYLFGESYVHYYDSLAVVIDTADLSYRLMDIARSDTTYDGIRMVIRDTIPADSLAVADSLALADSLVRVDSLSKIAKKLKTMESKVLVSREDKSVVRPEYRTEAVSKTDK